MSFYRRIEKNDGFNRFEVEIWKTKGKPFTLCCYDHDTREVIESLKTDENFLKLVKDKTEEEVKLLVVIMRCHETRIMTRKYGVQH